jgi:quinolinate synthase
MLSTGLVCPNMKKTTLQSVYEALKENKYDITLDETISEKARIPLDRMLQVK